MGSWRTDLWPRWGLRLDPQIYISLSERETGFPNCWAAQQLHPLYLELLSMLENVITNGYVWTHAQRSDFRLPLQTTHSLTYSHNVGGSLRKVTIQPVCNFSFLPNFAPNLLPSELKTPFRTIDKAPSTSWSETRPALSSKSDFLPSVK